LKSGLYYIIDTASPGPYRTVPLTESIKNAPEFLWLLDLLNLYFPPQFWTADTLLAWILKSYGIDPALADNYWQLPKTYTSGDHLVEIRDTATDKLVKQITVSIVSIDLDVGNGAGGAPDGDANDPEDGLKTFIPGERGGVPVISMSGKKLNPQPLKLIVNAPGPGFVFFELVSQSHRGGFSTDTRLPDTYEWDFSFGRDDDYGGCSSEIDNGKAFADLYCKDYAGTCCIKITFQNEQRAERFSHYINIPRDADGDGISDQWEENMVREWNAQYGKNETVGNAFFSPAEDKEMEDPDGPGPLAAHKAPGDGLNVLQEYRGFDFCSAPGWGGAEHYRRLSPARKEFLVEVDRSYVEAAPARAATQDEIKGSLEKAKAVFMNSAGVQLYCVVDNVKAPEAVFTGGRYLELYKSYVKANYNTDSSHNRRGFIYLLFALETEWGKQLKVQGVAPHESGDAIIDVKVLHESVGGNNAASRFSDLYSITMQDRFDFVVTHELGHTVGCKDHETIYPIPALRIRMFPAYYPREKNAFFDSRIVNNQFKISILPPAPGVTDLELDAYANANFSMQDVANAINALTGKYEARVPPDLASKHAWLLYPGMWNILHFADNSAPSTWSPFEIYDFRITSVMTRTPSVELYKNIYFNNESKTQPDQYHLEIGLMEVKNNHP
jgi:hypothetical protein